MTRPAGFGEAHAILLRPWAESDAPELREAIDEDLDHLKPWLSWTLEEPASLERTRERLREWVEAFEAGEGLRFAITPGDRPSHLLGGAHLNRRVGPDAHDIGYWVRKSAARRGIAGAAASRLVIHAFEERGVKRVVARSDTGNEASAAFARALGFEFVGNLTVEHQDGTPRPVSSFEMTRASYRRLHAPALRKRAARARLVT